MRGKPTQPVGWGLEAGDDERLDLWGAPERRARKLRFYDWICHGWSFNKGGHLNRDVTFNLYEYFNENGQRVEALIGTDDVNHLPPAELEESLANAVLQQRYGPLLHDGGDRAEATKIPEGADALVSMVGAVLDGAVDVPKAQTITSVSVNRRPPIEVAAILSQIEGLMDRQTARALRAVFGGQLRP